MKKNRHDWRNDDFIKDKTTGTCRICKLKRKLVRTPLIHPYYVYYSFNIRETKYRPDCLDGNKDQIKMF